MNVVKKELILLNKVIIFFILHYRRKVPTRPKNGLVTSEKTLQNDWIIKNKFTEKLIL